MAKVRDAYIDSIKSVLIFLVVLGHCVVRLGEHTWLVDATFNVIYLIHMPLFIFISGLLFNTQKNRIEIFQGCGELLATFFLFQFLWSILDTPQGWRTWISPAITLWYLISLVYWRIMLWIFRKVTRNKCLWLVIAMFMGVFVGYIPLNSELSFQRTFAFFPFFVAGNMLRGYDVRARMKVNKILLGIMLLLLILILAYPESQIKWLLCAKQNYYRWPVTLTEAPIYRIGWYMIVSFGAVVFLNLIPSKHWMSSFGGKTLTVYLLHFFPIWVLQKYVGFKTGNMIVLLSLACIIFAVTLYLHKFRVVRWLVKPLSLRTRSTINNSVSE